MTRSLLQSNGQYLDCPPQVRATGSMILATNGNACGKYLAWVSDARYHYQTISTLSNCFTIYSACDKIMNYYYYYIQGFKKS